MGGAQVQSGEEGRHGSRRLLPLEKWSAGAPPFHGGPPLFLRWTLPPWYTTTSLPSYTIPIDHSMIMHISKLSLLSDMMNQLNFLRGKGMANMYAWSSKR